MTQQTTRTSTSRTPPDLSEIMQLLARVMTRVGLHRTRTGSDTGLTSLQLTALSVIERHRALTMGQLSREMMTAQSAISRLVTDLSRKRLVRRTRDTKDRRVLRLTLTPVGKQTVEHLRSESQLLMARVLNKMTPAELTALAFGMDSLLKAVDEVEREVFLACAREECRDLVNNGTTIQSQPGKN